MGAVAPERLFYGTMLRDVFRDLADKSRGRGIADGLDPDVFGTAREMIAVSFDATSFVQRKFLALAAHRSAFGITEEMVSRCGAHARSWCGFLAGETSAAVRPKGGRAASTSHGAGSSS